MILTTRFWVVAHCPGNGENVYDVVDVLLRPGDHVPLIPLFEVVRRGGMLA